MAFGFPAYHTEELSFPIPKDDLYEIVLDVLESLSWSILEEREEIIQASTRISLWSWGERVTIEFFPDDTLSITSKCSLPTQCLDWGKNRSNVKKFIAKLRKFI